MRMYLETRARSDFSFETLSPAYFTEVLARMPGRARVALYFCGEELVGANLLLLSQRQLVDKFFVMQADVGRRLNLYFLSWLVNIEICLNAGLTSYTSGQGAAETKLRLGSQFSPNWIYYKHLNPVMNWVLTAVSRFVALEPSEEKLA
jgi:uncharacterized protein